ncbi:hypothetical protein MC885_017474 [Smutsia gigantea]|nr:hypothetical protein MC885_017474 [Smutsia gigantea]
MTEGRSWQDTAYRRSDQSVLVFFPAVAASPSPTPGHYHSFNRGRGYTQVSWHGQTYCLAGGYRMYGDAPTATPATAAAEKPAPRQARKRQQAAVESDEELCGPNRKLQQLIPQMLAGQATPAEGEGETPVPRRAPKRHPALTETEKEQLGCPPHPRKVRRLKPQNLAG